MNFSQELKRTRDKEARSRAADPAKNVVYSGDGSSGVGGTGYIKPADSLTHTMHDALNHAGLTGIPSFARSIVFYIDGLLGIETDAMGLDPGIDLEIIGGTINVSVAPVGADLICDINIGGVTAYTTQGNRPTIPDGDLTAALILPDIVAISSGNIVSLDIDQVGSTTGGNNLKLTLRCREVIT